MEKNSNATVFAIVKGLDESYGIVSVWISKEEAEKKVELLNAGMRYWDYEVEEVPLNGIGFDEADENRLPGVRATYDFAKHGWDVKKENIVFKEALVAWVTDATYDGESSFVAIHESDDACVEMIQKFAAAERIKYAKFLSMNK